MVTLAILLLPIPSDPQKLSHGAKIKLPEIAIGLLALSYFISSAINLSYPTGINANNFSSYQSPLNTYRVAKGFFWAVIFWPYLRKYYASDPEKTKNYFITGILTGLFLAGLAILWERGVMDQIFHWQGISQIIKSLLDFSTTYRITGLFSSMHVGGTSIDGYLIMVIPLCLYGLLSNKSTGVQMASLMCLMLASYAIMVTFSRGLYGGLLVVVLFLSLVLSHRYGLSTHYKPKKIIGLITSFVFLTFSIIMLYIYGGYGATVGGVFLILATAITTPLTHRITKPLSLSIFIAIMIIGSYVVFDSLSDSKWSENSINFSIIVAAITTPIFTGLTYFIGKSLLPESFSLKNEFRKTIIFSIVSSILWLAVIPPLLNSRVNVRFSTLGEDFSHRMDNWKKTLNFGENGLLHNIFGTGIGSFPRYYFFNNYQEHMLVNYTYGQDNDVNFLSVGHGDFSITQKIPAFRPEQFYLLRGKVRSSDPKYVLSIKICPKHILYSDRYIPQCISKLVQGTGTGQWQSFDIQVNSGKIGESGIFNWPITMLIYNAKRDTITDITDIQLLDNQGINLISNGDFKETSDRWIMIRDFSHDAWHAKNIFVHMIFEQGYFGLLAFLFLLFVALSTQVKAMKHKDPLAPLLIAAITGTLVVGLFGTVIDNPRVTTLYFLLIFFGLLNSPQIKTNKLQAKNG
ncbi:MAG: hypothetical protein JKY45_01945 [Emcibacter sp.]|nr:hypothetical protein [Emcibacter sp.]